MPTPDILLRDIVNTPPIPVTLSQQLAGKGNLLSAARRTLNQSSKQLRSLLAQAPNQRQTLLDTLQAHMQLDPSQCGVQDGERQVTLLTLAARLLAGPVFGNPFADWSGWGFADETVQAKMTGADWTQALGPVVNAAKFRAASNYWNARMPDTDISRQTHASHLLRQHFNSCLDIEYGLGAIDTDSWLQGRAPLAPYAHLQWQLPTGRRLTSTAALLISPRAEQAPWLLYLPAMLHPVLAFSDLERLRDWIFQHRASFWSDPRSPINPGTRDNVLISTVQSEGFASLIAEALRQHQDIADHHLLQASLRSETDPFDWSDLQSWENERSALVREALDATLEAAIDEVNANDAALAEEEVHFACLEQHLPIAWRNQLIERQETLLEQFLAGEAEPASAKVTLLRERQAALDLLQDSHDIQLLELPERMTDFDLQTPVGEKTWLAIISDGLCQAMQKEARLQHTLGELSATHLGWVEQLAARPEPSLRRAVEVRSLELVVNDRKWPLCGYMTFRALPSEDEEIQDPGVLLYRPGQRGGILAFNNESELARRLLATLNGAWPDALLESTHPDEGIGVLEQLTSSGSARFHHPIIESHFMQHCVQAIVTALPAETPREHARQRLCISENRARTAALARFAEQNRSSHIQTQLNPLRHLDATQLASLADQVERLQDSLRASADLLRLSLPSPQQFARDRLHQHLRSAFNVQDVPQITLNIADSVTVKKEVTGQSATGGAGSREVPVYSKARSDIRLETFILEALDDDRQRRLDNAILKLEPANSTLQRALTPAYLAELVTQLDAAGSYEQRIVNAYLGFAHETPWQVQWRQETFRTPYEHRLHLWVLSRPTSLDREGQQLLEKFYHEQVNTNSARTINHCSLMLKPGTAADGSSSRVYLSGITVIESASGPVLLYMPDAPNGTVISQHATSTAACEALQTMALDKKMARFLATRCLSGSPDEHERYIDKALRAGFRAFLEPGSARTKSLPAHESAEDMGELIRAHRATSRSQADIAIAAPQVFNRYFFMGLRMALGIVPGVGTALAFYDGWHAANAAVRAFEEGDAEDGLQQLVSLLQSLSDALLTLAPLAASAGTPAVTARLLTQQRQRLDPLRPATRLRKTPPSPFAGYEAELPAGPLQRSTLAHGAGIFEHAGTRQHYISRSSAWYAVEWDPAYLTWRLKPQGVRSYRQPVRLSEHGRWETPGRLNGLLVENGLEGGGGALGTLYNHGVAYWRQMIRRQPRQLTGMELVHDINDGLKRAKKSIQIKQADYRKALQAVADGTQPSDAQKVVIIEARSRMSDEVRQNIEFNQHSIARLTEQRATLNRRENARFISLSELNISEMSVLEMHLALDRSTLAAEQIRKAVAAFRELPASAPLELLKRLTRNTAKANQEMIETLLEMERLSIRHHAWRNHLQGSALTNYLMKVETTGLTLDVTSVRLARASFLATSLFNVGAIENRQLEAFMTYFHEQKKALRSTLFSHISLPAADLSRARERMFLSSAQRQYRRFLSHVTAWEDSFRDLLSTQETRSLRQLLGQLIDEIEDYLGRNTPRQRQAAQPGQGPSRPRLFETVEGPLIGTEYVERGQPRMRINQPHSDQPHTVYTRDAAGQWQLSAPQRAAPGQSMASLVETATTQLNDLPRQQATLRGYQTPHALPVDLEDIALGHAQQLHFIADRIRQKAAGSITPDQTALSRRLDDAAEKMQELGRQLRTAQTKATLRPTVGYLEYLLEHQEVEITWSRTLRPQLDRQGNPLEYLEEYRIIDRITRQPLWYAHFHFRRRPAHGFTRLEAGHLKLASERNQGEGAWRGAMNEAQANQMFGNLRPND
ncbi:dermonecrotic toxin domain-containing protein [Pseudomonas sp. NPDC089422]|uniref:dermonecrotic toxin domain-containing protein n=1 Tax=Pseudomonas sp. NPDC089422 TaxID=3364466 RepID=UPI00382594FE